MPNVAIGRTTKCPECGQPITWHDCHWCGGRGVRDGEVCNECGGWGGYHEYRCNCTIGGMTDESRETGAQSTVKGIGVR